MIDQTQQITINAEFIGVDINDGTFSASVKGGDSVKLSGISMDTWLQELRYVVSSFEWRSEKQQQEHKHRLELLQDSLADVLKKINAKEVETV